MVLRKLKVKRFQTNKSRLGYFNFGVRIGKKEFVYLRNNPIEKKSIECWKNNFYKAYRSENGNYVLLSIEGISLFNSSWRNRRNIFLDRNASEYQGLRRLAKYGKPQDLEIFLEDVTSGKNFKYHQ